MRAVYYEETGPAEQVLRFGDLPKPEPGPGDVLVRLAASGINPADVKRRAGWGGMTMQHSRVIPHCDGAGTIESVGQGVDPSRVGDSVWLWNAQGGYGEAGRAWGSAAEFIALPAEQAVTLPAHFTLEQGACLGVPAMTAHRCVMADGPVHGQTILVQGGAGAVGYLAVQIALIEGARVFATVSTPEAAERVRALGAKPINRHVQDVRTSILDVTADRGVDRIVEVDFAANQQTDSAIIKPNGTISSYSSSSNSTPPLDYYAFASRGANLRFIQGFALPDAARAQAIAWLAANKIDIPIAARFPLDTCAEAHTRVEQGGGFGQVVLVL
ncbi:MAG: NADPH:quinone reductase [Arenibacterium sp.]